MPTMMMYFKQLASESLVYGLSGVLSSFLSFFLVPFYTRVFSPEDYGVLSLVTTTMALLAIFVVLALDNSAHRWYWDTEDLHERKVTLASWTWCQISISLAFGSLVFFLSPWLGRVLVGREDAVFYFRLAAMTLPLGVLNMVILNWFRMQRRPWAALFFSLSTNLFNFLLTLTLVVLLRWGLTGVYVAQAISFAIGTTLAALWLGDWIAFRRFQWSRLTAMLKYALPMVPAGIAYFIVNLSSRYFIRGFLSTSEVGVYQVGSTVAYVVALVTGAFQFAWGPFAMSIHKQSDSKKVYAEVLLAYLWVTCLISTVISLFSTEILSFFATESYMGASRIVSILSFNYVVIGLGYIATIGPSIMKTTKPYGIAMVIAGGLNIVLNFILVPRFGKEGSAAATLIAQFIVPVYVFYYSQRLYPIPYRFGAALGIFSFAFVMATVGGRFGWSNSWLEMGLKLLLILLFFPLLFILRIVSLDQVRKILLSQQMGIKG
jgi:O-antigen/teichoic acid export membrane protein